MYWIGVLISWAADRLELLGRKQAGLGLGEVLERLAELVRSGVDDLLDAVQASDQAPVVDADHGCGRPEDDRCQVHDPEDRLRTVAVGDAGRAETAARHQPADDGEGEPEGDAAGQPATNDAAHGGADPLGGRAGFGVCLCHQCVQQFP